MQPWRTASDGIRRAAQDLVDRSVGTLPRPGETAPVVKVKQRRVRVVRANFFVAGRAPQVGEIIALDGDLAADLVSRRLAEWAT